MMRSPCPIGGSNAGLAQVKADGRLAQGKKDRGDEPTEPHVPPADLGIGYVLIEQSKHEGQNHERDAKLQQTAQEGLLGAVEQGGGPRQGGADDELDKEQEREGQDEGQ